MMISLRLNDEEAELIKKYAEMNGITVSDLVWLCHSCGNG